MAAFKIARAFALSPAQLRKYFQALLDADLLKHRLSDLAKPTVDDALMNVVGHTYCVVGPESEIVGEFTLDGFTGNSAQLHFSCHPDNVAKENRDISKFVHRQIFNTWRKADGSPYLDSLYGIQPLKNRVGCIFALRMGFKKVGVIKSVCHYGGKVCDGMISTMSRGDLNG